LAEYSGFELARAFRRVRGNTIQLDEHVITPGDPSPSKSRLETLMGVKEHEMHHRGQLMLIQRMLGVVPHLTRRLEAQLGDPWPEQLNAASRVPSASPVGTL
jgi:uncharacterized damage-inducible protein DinB